MTKRVVYKNIISEIVFNILGSTTTLVVLEQYTTTGAAVTFKSVTTSLETVALAAFEPALLFFKVVIEERIKIDPS